MLHPLLKVVPIFNDFWSELVVNIGSWLSHISFNNRELSRSQLGTQMMLDLISKDWLAEQIHCRCSVHWILLKAQLETFYEFRGEIIVRHGWPPTLDLPQCNCLRVSVRERFFQIHQVIEDGAKGPDIALSVIRSCFVNLRRHIVKSSDHHRIAHLLLFHRYSEVA